jgi:hypothetical protein
VKLLVIVFSCFLAQTDCAIQTNAPAETSTLSIRGKVLQERNGQPIRKANVQLSGQKGPAVAQYSAVTDADVTVQLAPSTQTTGKGQ